MAESLYLQLPRADGPARWLLVDTLGNRIGHVQEGALTDAAALQAKGRRLTVLLPAEQVTLTHVEVPSRNPQKVLQAVPYLLEDKLAEDVESLHFALGARTDAGQLVAVVNRDRLKATLDQLSDAGLKPASLVPDVCALAPEAGSVAVALDGDTAMVRTPDGGGFGADAMLAAQLVKRRTAADTSLTRVSLHGTPAEVDALDAALADTSLERIKHPAADGALPALAAGLGSQRGLDLLQGEFKQQTPLQEHWRTWRVAAILLALCLILGLTEQVVSYVKLRRQANALQAQVTQLFEQAMPGSRLVPGSEQQEMQARLAELQGGNSAGSLLALLDALGNGLGTNPSIQVMGLNYQSGSLQAQLQASDIGALDALKTALTQGGVRADLDSVNASGAQVTGRIVLTGSGS